MKKFALLVAVVVILFSLVLVCTWALVSRRMRRVQECDG